MYLAKTKDVLFHNFRYIDAEDTIKVLDTDDCVVETYKLADYTRWESMQGFYSIFIAGIHRTRRGVRDGYSIHKKDFMEFLKGRIEIKEMCINVDGDMAVDIYVENQNVVVFDDAFRDTMVKLEMPCRSIEEIKVSFWWAEKVGNLGYRFLVGVECSPTDTIDLFLSCVHMFINTENEIFVYRVQNMPNSDINSVIYTSFRPPKSLDSRLNLLEVV